MPLAVQQKTQYDIARKAMGITGIMLEMLPPLRPAVKSVDASAPGPYPKIALRVLDNALNQVIGQAIVIPSFISVTGKCIPIITVKPLACPKPHKTPAILNGADHITM